MNRTLLIIVLAVNLLVCQAQEKAGNADRFYVEDVLEYVPYAAIFGLKAFGVSSKSSFPEQLVTTGAAFLVNAGVVETLKHTVHSERPDKSDDHGFPSGHAAISFLGADILFEEYKDVSPWIGVGGYAVAATTSVLRVRHDRHHWLDVIGGAGIGICCSRLSQWLTPKLFHRNRDKQVSVCSSPCLYDKGMGLAVSVNF